MRVTANGRKAKYNYDDGVLASNLVLDQDDRDVDVTTADVRAYYALSPSLSLFGSAQHNWRRHDETPANPSLNRDSEGDTYLAGVRFDLTDLLVGELAGGQIKQVYEAPGVADSNSAAFNAALEWYPDELVTVTFGADRTAGDSGVIGAAGFVSDAISAQVDYEFRRNIIFGAGVRRVEDDYAGVARNDTRMTYNASVNYIVSRRWSAYVSYLRYEQDSAGDPGVIGRNFDLDQISVGIRLAR